MALQPNDLLPLYRKSDNSNRKITVEAFQSSVLPDGDDDNKMLVWNGATWVPGDSIDGGEYAT